MDIKEGYIPFKSFKTYYRIANPNGRKVPFLILHGGPGSTHNSYEVFDHLAFEDDRPFITYDQLGCGLSFVEGSHKDLWTKETWVEELINLRDQLSLKKTHLMGHSWGGMLEIIYMCDYHPSGVCSVHLSSSLASASLWKDETHRLINLMPEPYRTSIVLSEEKTSFDTLEFSLATEKYIHLFVSGPWDDNAPECLRRRKVFGQESYLTAWGPSEYTPLGNLKSYEYLNKLKEIKCPVLITSGANDESTPLQNKVMYDEISSEKRWVLFSKSRHMSYVEEHEKYSQVLLDFLNETDE